MPRRDNKIGIHLEGKDKASPQVKKVDKQLDKVGKTAKTTGSRFSGLADRVKGLVSGFGILLGAGGIAGVLLGFKKLVDASSKQEEIFRKLETAVDLSGAGYQKNKKRIDDFLASMQATTRFGDTDLAPALQRITQLTGSLEKGFEGSKMAADIASAGLFDLKTASTYVSMAMAGEVTMLGRYIPELKITYGLINQNMTATEKWAIAKELLNKKFAGAAQRDLDTFAGTVNQLKNYMGDIAERFGDVISLELKDEIKGWTEKAKEFIESGNLELWAIRFESLLENAVNEAGLLIEAMGKLGIIPLAPKTLTELDKRIKEIKNHMERLNKEIERIENADFHIPFFLGGKEPTEQRIAVERLKNELEDLYELRLKFAAAPVEPIFGPMPPLGPPVPPPDYAPAKAVTEDYYNWKLATLRTAQEQEIELIGAVPEYEREIYSERSATLGEWLQSNLEVQAVLANANEHFWQLVIRGDMTGSQKRKAIWESTRSVIMGIIADMVKREILADFAVSGAAMKTITTNLAAAAAKIFKAHSGIPFVGVAIATGLITAMYATMKSLGGFQSGTDYVPRTGMYMLHKGEAVVPRWNNTYSPRVENYFILPEGMTEEGLRETFDREVLLKQIKALISEGKI